MTTTLYHLYGIVAADATFPPTAPPHPCHLLPYGALAALVAGPLDAPRPMSRAALLDHADTLNRVAASTAVLPLRFGTVLDGVHEVRAMLAAHGDDFQAALEALRGRTQFTVKAQHDRDTVLQEIADSQPEIARLRDLLAAECAGYYEQVRLGELVAQAMTTTCETDAQLLWDLLTPHAVAALPRTITAPESPFGGAFLIDDERRADFVAAAEQLARQWAGRVRLRLLGPLAAYDFVTAQPATTGVVDHGTLQRATRTRTHGAVAGRATRRTRRRPAVLPSIGAGTADADR